MPDIQKCSGAKDGDTCSIRESCWRYKARDSYNQAYGPPIGDFKPETGCDGFMSEELF
jgi:hypothetical protein